MNDNETVEQVCEEMTSCHSPEVNCEDVRNYGYRVSAAHKRELATKDEEIDSLKWKVENYAQVVAAKGREIAERDALIRELSDALCRYCRHHTVDCWTRPCDIAKKARKMVVSKNATTTEEVVK